MIPCSAARFAPRSIFSQARAKASSIHFSIRQNLRRVILPRIASRGLRAENGADKHGFALSDSSRQGRNQRARRHQIGVRFGHDVLLPVIRCPSALHNQAPLKEAKKTRRPSRVSGDRRRIYAFGRASGRINRRRRHRRHRDRHRGHHRDRRRDQAGGCRLRGRARCAPRHIRGRFRWPRRSRIRTRCCP